MTVRSTGGLRWGLAASLLVVAMAGPAVAGHMQGWRHDHSSSAIFPRPHGYSAMVNTFGNRCTSWAQQSRTWFPSAQARGQGGYVVYHGLLARNVGGNIRNHINADHRNKAVDYGVYGYLCRQMTGSSNWSVHAWGAAVDTNTDRNPRGQGHWDGRGSDWVNYGKYIPNIWKGPNPGHRFYWGLQFSYPDPHHFQYVTGY